MNTHIFKKRLPVKIASKDAPFEHFYIGTYLAI